MLNATCWFEDPIHIVFAHYFCSLFSIPIYGTAFLVLLLKCPPNFHQYRNYLIIHITSGVLLEIQMGFWRLNVTFPWGALCSNGYMAEYSPNLFQLWIMLFHFTAFSTINLFIHRMKVAVFHTKKPILHKLVYFMKYAFYLNVPILFALNVLIYPDLIDQKEYKIKIEQSRGKFPNFMWCGNCFFMQFDSWIFIVFYVFAYTAVLFAFLAGGLATYVTIRSLSSINLQLSARTVSIHKNFLFSLVVAAFIHISFIFIPLSIFFAANFLVLPLSSISHYLTMVVQEHGTASTLTMLVTNTLLRKEVLHTFSNPFSRLKPQNNIPSILISYAP